MVSALCHSTSREHLELTWDSSFATEITERKLSARCCPAQSKSDEGMAENSSGASGTEVYVW